MIVCWSEAQIIGKLYWVLSLMKKRDKKIFFKERKRKRERDRTKIVGFHNTIHYMLQKCYVANKLMKQTTTKIKLFPKMKKFLQRLQKINLSD